MNRKTVKKSYKEKKRELKAGYHTSRRELKEQLYGELDGIVTEQKGAAPVNPPKRSPLEEIGNSVTHCVGAVFSVAALVLMCVWAEGVREYVGAVLYSFGLLVMFTMSCLYHSFPHGSRVKRLFRRFDYSCIYLLIGATFAPILLSYVGGTFGITFLIIQWAVIVTGITLVGVFGPTRLRFIHIPLYVILGWVGLMFLPTMVERGDLDFLGFILGGGVIYSVGIIPFALKKRAAHFIWHFFVLAGAVVQWVGIFTTIYLK